VNETLAIWLLIIGIGAATYAMRLSFLVAISPERLPAGLQRALRFVPVAALTAIVVPALLGQQAAFVYVPEPPRLLAGLLAALVAWRTRNVLLTIIVGMGIVWIGQAVFP
jgi:branched-subunit amino acid transport protein